MLTKRDRNRIYEAIVQSGLDPTEFDLSGTGNRVVITHNSGSTFEFSRRNNMDEIKANIVEGDNWTVLAAVVTGKLEAQVERWANEIRQTVGVPDYWEELKRQMELVVSTQDKGLKNMSFTTDEMAQIVIQLQKIKKQLREQFELTSVQMEQMEERLNEAEQASKRMGRKDWMLLFSQTVRQLRASEGTNREDN